MNDFELEEDPFYYNSSAAVALFKGVSLARNGLPVVVKRHDFMLIQQKSTQVLIAHAINTALAQAKVHHPNTYEILEVQLEIDKSNCAIFHVLEAMDSDVSRDIQERKQGNRSYEEAELRLVLQQTANALAFAHNKGIAHRDVKPNNIFRTGNTYKVGDFGCFFQSRDSSVTKKFAGDIAIRVHKYALLHRL